MSTEQILSQIREKIPEANLEKFDISAADLLKTLAREPDRYYALTSEFWQHCQILISLDSSTAPPWLCRHINETIESYINRCYKAGGYK